MQIALPEKVKIIIRTLEDAGYEAYAVGGCVRDTILGRTPKDWDVTTSALPQEVKGLFAHTVDTGIQHGTVTVLMDHEGFEVTTYRIDGIYEDARHPKEVIFTSDLAQDLQRRDFTVNAMAYNDRDGLVDLYNGQEDLAQGVIRCVGEAKARFEEDALRMMRAIRFAAQLGFRPEEDTYRAICDMAPLLAKISMERIQSEMMGILTSDHPGLFREVYRTGLSKVFLPEFDRMMGTPQNTPHHCFDVGEHTMQTVEHVQTIGAMMGGTGWIIFTDIPQRGQR